MVSIPILQKSTFAINAPHTNYTPLQPLTTVLPKGHQKTHEYRPFPAPTILDRDIPIKLRDGTTIRADVFRPLTEKRVPAILAWGPFGKSGVGLFSLDLMPGRCGIPKSEISGYETWEGPDPAEWVARGYAVVNVDPRGVFDSEGDLRWLGKGEGQDGYDTIEEVAKLPWCNGSIGMAGTSWLAMAQWFIAAEKPPHLKCIAPFEGGSDFYRDTLCRGGVPYLPFWEFLGANLCGRHQQEDVVAMLEQYPFMNQHWADKRAKVEHIDIPTYVVASYSTGLHTMGSLRGFEDIKHDKKWLRIHATREWHDFYQKETTNELQLFFDHYLKDAENRWESTPKVRVSVLGFNRDPTINLPFPSWPIPSTKHATLYLSPSSQLLPTPSQDSGVLTYQSDTPSLQIDADSSELLFTHTFPTKTHLIGSSRAILYMRTTSHNDMDVFVQLRKASSTGKLLQSLSIPLQDLQAVNPKFKTEEDVPTINSSKYLGPSGILRASRRKVDNELTKGEGDGKWDVLSHRKVDEKLLRKGEVVKLEIGIWATGMVFEAGEQLVLKVSGHMMGLAEYVPLRGMFRNGNREVHELLVGGDFESRLVVPVVEL